MHVLAVTVATVVSTNAPEHACSCGGFKDVWVCLHDCLEFNLRIPVPRVLPLLVVVSSHEADNALWQVATHG